MPQASISDSSSQANAHGPFATLESAVSPTPPWSTPKPSVAFVQIAAIMSMHKAPSGHFTLLYFASATSYTKKQYDFLPAPLPVNQLFGELEKRYPHITDKVLRSAAVTVNLEYVDLDESAEQGDGVTAIAEGDEVAIIPPVSSG